MSAQAERAAREIRVDLRHPQSWTPMDDEADTSFCGRYVIRSCMSGAHQRWLAWRTRRDERGRWSPPELLGGFPSADMARLAAWEHAQREDQ